MSERLFGLCGHSEMRGSDDPANGTGGLDVGVGRGICPFELSDHGVPLAESRPRTSRRAAARPRRRPRG